MAWEALQEMMTVGSLFSGIGGFDLGLERAGMRVVWQVENNPFCRSVLRTHWPTVPCYDDIRAIDWRLFHVLPSLICAGFPCQPFSCAGKRRGAEDDRYLWPEVVRCLDALRPAWFLGENVPGIINLALDQVCTDLENLGYAVQAFVIPACAVDAPHIRKRVWILAHHQGSRGIEPAYEANARAVSGEGGDGSFGSSADVADDPQHGRRQGRPWGSDPRSERQREQSLQDVGDTDSKRQTHVQGSEAVTKCTRRRTVDSASRWIPEPNVGRVAHGVPHRVDRLRALGNAIVPQIAEILGAMILEVSA